ncbi:MAG: hypothetical protein KDC12_06710 [Flavobacteriales bacterium]|nr:hypothetical protein [Flavobacteriales bacterium]
MRSKLVLLMACLIGMLACKKDDNLPVDCKGETVFQTVTEDCVPIYFDNLPGPNMVEEISGDVRISVADCNPNDHSEILYVNRNDDEYALFTMNIENNQYSILGTFAEFVVATWMDDGWIYFVNGGIFQRIHPESNAIEVLADDSFSYSLKRNYDGTQLIRDGLDSMEVRDLFGNTTMYPSIGSPLVDWGHPDGKILAVNGHLLDIYSDFESAPLSLDVGQDYIRGAVWTPDYTRVVFTTIGNTYLYHPETQEVTTLIESCNALSNRPQFTTESGIYLTHSDYQWIDSLHYEAAADLVIFDWQTATYEFIDTPVE